MPAPTPAPRRGLSVLELALKQTGPASVKRAADYAQRAAAAEGSNAGIIKARCPGIGWRLQWF